MTIEGELRLPGVFLQGRTLEEIERQLQVTGLMPIQAQQRRWRMDPEAPGGYLLTFTFVLEIHD